MTPDLVTPLLSFQILFVCLPKDVMSLHTANMPKPSVSDDICVFRGDSILSDLDIL